MSACRHTLLMFSLAVVLVSSLGAQETLTIVGDYVGTSGPLNVRLHIKTDANGKFSGALDSPDQGTIGLPLTDIRVDGQVLSFNVPSVGGSWKGSIENNATRLNGAWTQRASSPLIFTRDTFVAASKPSPVDGFWLGTLATGTQSLRIQLTVRTDQAGQQSCTADSLDQNAFNMTCVNVLLSGSDFSFEVPAGRGRWTGTLAADGKSLDGTWIQANRLPLRFDRQATRQGSALPRPAPMDPAIAAVSVTDMQSVLARDLDRALRNGVLAPETGLGISIGIVRNGERRVFYFGAAKVDSLFEIGSVTKTFTGLLLAQMIVQDKVKLDMPVRELLPPGTAAKPQGDEITLLDLVTHHSGLPRLPDNLNPADPANPYADYRAASLYEFIKNQGVGKPAATAFLYSNLGFGLLGQVLADRANESYADLIRQSVLEPLGMRDTAIALSPDQQRRFIPGHLGVRPFSPVRGWDLDALAGAGAIRSTAGDMLTYIEAQLHPEKLAARTLSSALAQSHELKAEASANMRVAYAWLHITESGDYWHNGGTGGYSSYCFFNPKEDYGAVVLMNAASVGDGSFADLLGQHISQRFAGRAAVSLP